MVLERGNEAFFNINGITRSKYECTYFGVKMSEFHRFYLFITDNLSLVRIIMKVLNGSLLGKVPPLKARGQS